MTSNKKSKNILMPVIMILASIGAYVLYQNFMKNSEENISIPVQAIQQQVNYDTFVGAWNDKVRAYELSDAHLLSSTDSEKTLQSLKKYVIGYSSSQEDKVQQELLELSDNQPNSIFKFYQDFQITHLGKLYTLPSDLKNIVNSDALFALVQKTTGNSDVDGAIKLILASSDPCAFFAIYKYELRKRGLNKEQKTCDGSIIDAAEFPKVAALIQ